MEVKRIFIDSNIFLNILLEESEDYKASVKLLKDVENNKFTAVTTLLNIMEILFVLRRIYKENDKEIIESVEKLFEIKNLKVAIPSEFHIIEAYNLQKMFRFQPNDAIFISIARSESDIIATRDEELKDKSSSLIECLTPEEIPGFDRI